jgi:regulator of sigma E protease
MDWVSVIFWVVGTLIAVLAPMIIIHELGHFSFAKLAGIRVEEFGLGYPPRLLKLWRGKGHLDIDGTRITIPWGFRLPKGVEIGIGVDGVTERRDDGTYILRHFRVLDPLRDDLSRKQEDVEDGVHIRGELTTFEPGTLYSLNWLPMGGFARMTGEEDPSDPKSFAAQPKRWRIAVLTAGPVFNIVAAAALLVGAYMMGVPTKWQVEITRVVPESAAEAAGLEQRDIVVAVDGERIEEGMEHLRRIIRAAPERTVQLTILRDTETLTVPATPQRTEDGYGLLGIVMAPWPDRGAVEHYSLPVAVRTSVADLSAAIVATLQVPARLAQGSITPQEARPASVVGLSGILAFTLQQSIEWGLPFPVMQTASLISIALGLTNLLPLPALDGGRILFVLIEAVRGRRVAAEREAVFHLVGLAILVTIMAFVMLQDLINPIIPWSMLR